MALQDVYLRVGLRDSDVVQIQRDFANLAVRGGRDMNDAFRASFANTREILKSALRMDGNAGQSLATSIKTALSGATRVAEAEVARLTASLARTRNNGQKIQIERSLAMWQTELSNLSKHHAQINNVVAAADAKMNSEHGRALEIQAGMDNRENARRERMLRQRVRMQNQARRDIEISNERQYQNEIKLAARTEAEQRRAYSRSLPGRFGEAALNTGVYGTIGAIGYYGREAVNRGIQREQSLAKVVAMSSSSSPLGKMGSAMDVITDVANKTGMAASEVDALALAVAQAGISGKDTSSVLLGLAQAMRLSFGELDATSAVRGFNVLRNTFYANEDAASKNAKAMYNLHEAIQMANSSASDAGQIVEAISKVSGAARMAKIDNKALEAILVTTQEISGTGAGTAATALRRTIPRLSAPETSEKMQGEFGIRYIDDNGDYLSKFKILEQIASKYRELISLGQEKRAEDLAQAAAGNVQYSTMSQVFVAMGQYHDLLKKLTDVEYNRDRQIIAANDNLQTSFTKMWNVLEKGGVALMRSGGEFNVLKAGVDALSYSIGSISFDGMANGLALAALAAGGLAFKLAAVAAEQRALAALATGGSGAGSAAAWGAGGAVAGAAGTVLTGATIAAGVITSGIVAGQAVGLNEDKKLSSETKLSASLSDDSVRSLAMVLSTDKFGYRDNSLTNDIAIALDKYSGKRDKTSSGQSERAVIARANEILSPNMLETTIGGIKAFVGSKASKVNQINPAQEDALEQAIAVIRGSTIDDVKTWIENSKSVVTSSMVNSARMSTNLMRAVSFSPESIKKLVNNPAQRAKEAMDLLSSTKDLMLPAQTRLVSGDTSAIEEMKGSRVDATRAIEEIRKAKKLFGDEVSSDLVAKAELVYNQIISDVVGAEKTQVATANSNAKKAESKLKEAQNETATAIVENFSDQMAYFIGEMKKPSSLSVYTGEFKKLSNSILPDIEDMFGSLVNEDIKRKFKDKTRGGIALGASSLYSAMSYAGGLGGSDVTRFNGETYDWDRTKEEDKTKLEIQKRMLDFEMDSLVELEKIAKSNAKIAEDGAKLSAFEKNAGGLLSSALKGKSFSAGDLFSSLLDPISDKAGGNIIKSLTRSGIGGSSFSIDDITGIMQGIAPESYLDKRYNDYVAKAIRNSPKGSSPVLGSEYGDAAGLDVKSVLAMKAVKSKAANDLLGSQAGKALGQLGMGMEYYTYIKMASAILKSAGIGTTRVRTDDRSTADAQNTLISDLFSGLKERGSGMTSQDIAKAYGYEPVNSTVVKRTETRKDGVLQWINGGKDQYYESNNAGAKTIDDLYKMTYDAIINTGKMDLKLKDNELDQMFEKLDRNQTLIEMEKKTNGQLDKIADLEVESMKIRQEMYDNTISGYMSTTGMPRGVQDLYAMAKKYGSAPPPIFGDNYIQKSRDYAWQNLHRRGEETLDTWTQYGAGGDMRYDYTDEFDKIFGALYLGKTKIFDTSLQSFNDTVDGLNGLVGSLEGKEIGSPEYDALMELINIGSDMLSVQQSMLDMQLEEARRRVEYQDYLSGSEANAEALAGVEKSSKITYDNFSKKLEEALGASGISGSSIVKELTEDELYSSLLFDNLTSEQIDQVKSDPLNIGKLDNIRVRLDTPASDAHWNLGNAVRSYDNLDYNYAMHLSQQASERGKFSEMINLGKDFSGISEDEKNRLASVATISNLSESTSPIIGVDYDPSHEGQMSMGVFQTKGDAIKDFERRYATNDPSSPYYSQYGYEYETRGGPLSKKLIARKKIKTGETKTYSGHAIGSEADVSGQTYTVKEYTDSEMVGATPALYDIFGVGTDPVTGNPLNFDPARIGLLGEKYKWREKAISSRISEIIGQSQGVFGNDILGHLYDTDYINSRMQTVSDTAAPQTVDSVKTLISELQASVMSLMQAWGAEKTGASTQQQDEESRMYQVNSTGKYYITQNFSVESTYFGGSKAEAVQFLRFLSESWNDSGLKNSGSKLF